MKRLIAKIKAILRNRRTRKLWMRVISVAASLVVFVTTYALVLPAITMEKTADCGIEEHQHDDSCYELRLVCGLEESAEHHHTDACYEKVLTCTKEVHTHSAACYHSGEVYAAAGEVDPIGDTVFTEDTESAGEDALTGDTTDREESAFPEDQALQEDAAALGDQAIQEDSAALEDQALQEDAAALGDQALQEDPAALGDQTLQEDSAALEDQAIQGDTSDQSEYADQEDLNDQEAVSDQSGTEAAPDDADFAGAGTEGETDADSWADYSGSGNTEDLASDEENGEEDDTSADTEPALDEETAADVATDTGSIADTGAEAAADGDTETAADVATDTGSIADTGAEAASDADTETAAYVATDTGMIADTGAEAAADADTETAADGATDTGSIADTGAEAAVDSDTETAADTATDTGMLADTGAEAAADTDAAINSNTGETAEDVSENASNTFTGSDEFSNSSSGNTADSRSADGDDKTKAGLSEAGGTETTTQIMPAMSFSDTIRVTTGKPAALKEGTGGTLENAAEALPEEADVSVRVEADEGTFPAGTTMVLRTVEDLETIEKVVKETVETTESATVTDTAAGAEAGNSEETNSADESSEIIDSTAGISEMTDNSAENSEMTDNTVENSGETAETGENTAGDAQKQDKKNPKTYGFQAVDITFLDVSGIEIEPAKPVRVSLTSEVIEQIRQEAEAENSPVADPVVVHMDNEGNAQQMDLMNPEDVEPAQGRTEEELLEAAAADQEEKETTLNGDLTETSGGEDAVEAVENEESVEDKAAKNTGTDTISETDEKESSGDSAGDSSNAPSGESAGNDQTNAEETETLSNTSTVYFETDAFSIYAIVYTVDFHYDVDGKSYDYSIRGGDAISLKELLPVLNVIKDDESTDTDEIQTFINDIDTVRFSDESLVKAARIDENTTAGNLKEKIKNETGAEVEYSANLTEEQIAEMNAKEFEAVDWALVSMKAFETEETLTVTMKNGEVFVIKVTDAQNIGDSLNGKTKVISNNGYAMIGDAEIGYGGRKDLKSSNNLSDERAPWTFIYDSNQNKYYLKSYNGKFLKFEPTDNNTILRDVTLVDSQNNATAVTIEEENGKYRISADSGNSYNPFKLQYHENGQYDPFFAGQYALTGGTEWLTFSDYSEVVLPKDWLLYLDKLEHGEEPLEVTVQVGDTLTLRPYTEWVWKHQNEEDQSLTWDFSGWTQGSGYININTGETSDTQKNGYISATTYSNGTITFYKYTRSDGEICESNYPVYRATATTTGNFYLKTNEGNIVHVTVKSKDKEVTNPTVITNSASQKVNLFNYDLDYDLDVEGNKASSWNENGYSTYETGVNKGSDLKFLGWGAGDSNIEAYKINNYSKANPKQGIVSNVLVNGYPELAGNTRINQNKSLKYLFSDEQGSTSSEVFNDVEKHMDVDGLFQLDADGYYYYNSNMNYAYYDESSNKFVLYDHTYTQNTANNGIIAKPMGFFPFHEYNSSKHLSPNHTEELDHHFGMSMTREFTIPTSDGKDKNGNPYIFEFSGDDDMWVFIDGVLVLDVGGIHQPVTGKIDFSTGKATVQGGGTYDFNNPNAATTSTEYTKTIAQQFTDSQTGKTFANNDGKTHTLQIFYLERGGCDSNCSIRFNLPTYKTLDLAKRLRGLTSSELAKYKDEVFTYELKINGVLYNSPAGAAEDQSLKAQRIGADGVVKEYFTITNGQITIKDGETVRIPHLSPTDTFYVAEEKSLNMEQFEAPHAEREYYTVSDSTKHEEEVTLTQSNTEGLATNLDDWTTPQYTVNNTEKVTFTNTLKEKDLEVEKIWKDEKDHSATPIKFKVDAKAYGDDSSDPVDYVVEALKASASSTTNDKEFELNAANNWKYTIESLPMVTSGNDAGKRIIYSVNESTAVEGYTSTIKEISSDQCNIDAVKLWPDNTDRTEVIKVKLKNAEGKYYAGIDTDGNAIFNETGLTYDLTSDNDYTYRFHYVPVPDAKNTYTLEEVNDIDENTTGLVMYTREIIRVKITNTPTSEVDPTLPSSNVENHKRIDALRDGKSNPDTTLDEKEGEDLTDLYRLYLDYKVNSVQEASGVDLLFVIDHSGSMNNKAYGGNPNRAPSVLRALNGTDGVVQEFLNMNDLNRWAAVGFKGAPGEWYREWYQFPYISAGPWTNYQQEYAGEEDSEILSATKSNGVDTFGRQTAAIKLRNEGDSILTDYTAGFWRAEQFLFQDSVKNDGRKKVVVFISDGIPTLYIPCVDTLANAGTTDGSYYWPDWSGGCPTETLAQFENFVKDVTNEENGYSFGGNIELFTIGFGSSMLDEEGNEAEIGPKLLKDMLTAAYRKDVIATNYMYIADSGQAAVKLKTNLQGIVGASEKYKSVVIQDDLSEYVDLYDIANTKDKGDSEILKAAGAKVTMTDPSDPTTTITLYENGTLVEANNMTSAGVQILQSVTYDAADKKVIATFNPAYEAQQGITYTLSFDVKTTDAAYTTYADTGYDKEGEEGNQHVIQGDADTDYKGTNPANSTSSGKDGFHSNDSATVTYKHNDVDESKEYPHPVIQVFAAPIQMLKTDQVGAPLKNATFSLYKDAYDASGTDAAATANAKNLLYSGLTSTEKGEGSNKVAEIALKKLRPGTYYLVETKAPDGYNSTEPVKIVVKLTTQDIITVTGSIGSNNIGSDDLYQNSGDWVLKVMNTAGVELPATGGPGTRFFYLLGTMLIVFAGMIFVLARRRESMS